MNKDARFAIFIDADNISAKNLSQILPHLGKLGKTWVARAYGDWTQGGLKDMSATLTRFKISKIQQDRYTKGKNATDIRLAIDATQLYLTEGFDVAVLVTGDSDFTPLVEWMKTQKLEVLGILPSNHSDVFRASCDDVLDIEGLLQLPAKQAASEDALTFTEEGLPETLDKLLGNVETYLVENNRLFPSLGFSEFCQAIHQVSPTAIPHDFGWSNWEDLLIDTAQKTDRFAVHDLRDSPTICLASAREQKKKCKRKLKKTLQKVFENFSEMPWFYGIVNEASLVLEIKKIIPNFSPRQIDCRSYRELFEQLNNIIRPVDEETNSIFWLHGFKSPLSEEEREKRLVVYSALEAMRSHRLSPLKFRVKVLLDTLERIGAPDQLVTRWKKDPGSILDDVPGLLFMQGRGHNAWLGVINSHSRPVLHALESAITRVATIRRENSLPATLSEKKWSSALKEEFEGFSFFRVGVKNFKGIVQILPQYWSCSHYSQGKPRYTLVPAIDKELS